MKKSIAGTVTLILALVPSVAHSDAWQPPLNDLAADQSSFLIDESSTILGGSSAFVHLLKNGENHRVQCSKLGEGECPRSLLSAKQKSTEGKFIDPFITVDLLMPSCSETEKRDWCIEDARIYKQSTSPVSAVYLGSAEGTETDAEPDFNLPSGGTFPLYEAGPGSNLEGTRFAVSARMTFANVDAPGAPVANYRPTEVEISVLPFELRPFPRPGEPGFGIGRYKCVYRVDSNCGFLQDFPPNSRVGLTIRTKYGLKEFFSGRLDKTDISIEDQAQVSVLRIDANPVFVPTIHTVYSEGDGLREKLRLPRPGHMVSEAWNPSALEAITHLREHMKDTATAIGSYWRLTAIGTSGFKCYEDTPFAGLVTTNASAFEGIDPPRLNGGYIDYRVAGMHYLPNGKDLFEGSYELILRSEAARCLYGYTSAPISAKVTVVGVGGEQKIATTQVSERDGWLKLSAHGFTFSENKIRAEIRGTPAGAPSNGESGSLKPNPANPINSKVVFRSSLPAFSANSAKLSKVQTSLISRLVKPTAKTITCTTAYAQDKEASLARRQAESVCAAAKKIAKKAKVTSKIMKLPISQAGLVEIRTT